MRADKIVVKGLHVSVRVGVKKEEQEVRRNCEIDLQIVYDLTNAAKSDELDKTVNYSKVIDLIQEVSKTAQYKLLEAFAYRLFDEIFRHTAAKRISLRVKKMNPPIEGRFEYVGVELTRNREDFNH